MEKPNASDIEAKRLKLEIELLEEQQYVENRLNNRQAAVISEKEQGLASAISPNTEKALRHAVKHFTQFSGENALPCGSDELYNYLIYYSGDLKVSTLDQRRRMLGLWHKKHGYPDPNDDKKIRLAMRRIRKSHNAPPKQAKPATRETILELDSNIAEDIDAIQQAMSQVDGDEFKKLLAQYRTLLRDRAMILVAFWFGLRSDELSQIMYSHLEFNQQAETPHFFLFLPKSKTDKDARGRKTRANAKPSLCPMSALDDWFSERAKVYADTAGKLLPGGQSFTVESNEDFPVFSKIHWRGNVLDNQLKANSINPILKPYFDRAGIGQEGFSSHSMRRGLANWLMDNGANLHELMQHIGWSDINSAMRYLDGKDALPDQILDKVQEANKLDELISLLEAAATKEGSKAVSADDRKIQLTTPDEPPTLLKTSQIEMHMEVFNNNKAVRGKSTSLRNIEKYLLPEFKAKKLEKDGVKYELTFTYEGYEDLDEQIRQLTCEMNNEADRRYGFVECDFFKRDCDHSHPFSAW